MSSNAKPANPIIVALDVPSAAEARSLVDALGDSADFYKVGLELYAAEGMPFIREIAGQGKRVFLDLKLYDIGETVKRATARLAGSGATLLTVHGSAPIVRAAVDGRGTSPIKILAVTVLTSLDRQDIADEGFSQTVSELAALRARACMAAGADGLIGSPLEAATLRAIAGPEAILVTPGVRSPSVDSSGQKRVATPAEALSAGADYIVVGRQITRAQDPRQAMERLKQEIRAAVLS